VVSKCVASKLRSGVSDLIIILALIAVAIPVTFTVQQWLSSQANRVATYSTTPKVTVNLASINYGVNTVTLVVKVVNTWKNIINLSSVNTTAILSNGNNITLNVVSVIGDTNLSPGNEATLVLNGVTSTKVTTVIFQFRDNLGNTIPAELTLQ
jgi:hypothetical protein